MSRILFITANRIGDAVLSTGALEEARRRVPDASVVVACGPLAAPLFRAVPGIEAIHVLGKEDGRWRKLWGALRKERYDLAIDLRGSMITAFLRVKERIVFKKSKIVRHKTAELAELMGAAEPLAPKVWLDSEAEAAAETLAPKGRPILALGPGTNFIGKRWPPEHFAELGRRIAGLGAQGPLPGAIVALLGGPGDESICAEIAEELRAGFCETVEAAGRLDLLANAALLARASLFVGNDSGLMHLAAAMGAPTLGLFGPSNERVYGPWGSRARAVRGARTYEELMEIGPMQYVTRSLMEDLEPAKVEAAALNLLEETGAWARATT